MTRTAPVSRIIAYWLKKADDALAAARDEHEAGRYDFAVNRAYYAAFYAASAVLLKAGKRFVKHAGLRAAIHRDLVKADRLAADLGRAFDRLFESRQRADYVELVHVEAAEAAALIAQARDFVAAMRGLARAAPRRRSRSSSVR